MRIAVVALGKIGLPLAAQYASKGHTVVGADVNPDVVAAVNAGRAHVLEEPGLAERVAEAVAAGRLSATSSLHAGGMDSRSMTKSSRTRVSMRERAKQSSASSGVHTMGSPRTLKEVFTRTAHPVFRSNADSSSWYREFVSLCTVCTRAE